MTGVLDTAGAREWIEQYAERFGHHRDDLTELDRQSGDGDFGANIQGALDVARAALDAAELTSIADVFNPVSRAFMRAGGTSGPLYGMWFRAFAETGAESAAIDLATLAEAAAVGVAAVQRIGKADVGDCTMVDAMVPAAVALTQAADHDEDLATGLGLAALAARAGADSTAELIARRGRASYVGEVAQGVLDPGAVAVALFFESAPGVANPTDT